MPGRDEEFKAKAAEAARRAQLAGGRVIQKQAPQTEHVSTLVGCEVDIDIAAMPPGIVTHYRLLIHDKEEHHKYILAFNQVGREALLSMLKELPDIGTNIMEQENGEVEGAEVIEIQREEDAGTEPGD